MPTPLIVAIDGPAGAGKSTVSKILARRLGYSLVDTGAIYRCVALSARRLQISATNDEGLSDILNALQIEFQMHEEENRVFLAGEDVSDEIRTPEISMLASQISSRPVVRSGLLELQRRLARHSAHGTILEGRDIGTVVFPDADVKIFLVADAEIRARRRFEELFARGNERPLDEVRGDQNRRDKDDSERVSAPLRAAADAVTVDSSSMPLSDVVFQIEQLVLKKADERRSKA